MHRSRAKSLPRRAAALAVVLLFSARAHAATPTTVYTGTLGGAAIVLELTPGGDADSAGRYFYVRQHRDLNLSGRLSTNGDAQLREGWDEDGDAPRITLRRQAGGGWRGSWTSSAGKALPVVLAPARPSRPPADAPDFLKRLYDSDPYAYLRLAGLRPQAGKRETFMGHTLQWWRVPGANVAFFEILDGYPEASRRRINEVLMSRMWQEAAEYYDCMHNPSAGSGYDVTVTPSLLTPSVVSVGVFISSFCGGAYPDSGDANINLDARTAQPLALEDVLWAGEGEPHAEPKDANGNPAPDARGDNAWSDYREQRLPSWLVGQWRALHAVAPQPGKTCDYDDLAAWSLATWRLTPAGILFVPSFPVIERACEDEDWSVLPWRVVRQHPGRLKLALPD